MAMALGEGDRISQLPDEILVTIHSLLETWEAGRNCVLSKRWTYLWTYVTSINFDGNDEQHGRSNRDWGRVSRVLGLHQGSTLNEFRVDSPFKLDSGSSFEIDDWVKFAMRKRVRKLVLHLRNRVTYVDKSYSFPRKLFESTFAVSWMQSLTHLSLKYINITDDLVEHFLSKCQLQHFCVSGSKNLVNLKVVCLTFMLKFLEISDCSNLQKVEVVAPSYLMSFIYHDYSLFRGEKQPGIVLEQTPSLVKVSLGDGSVYRKRCGFLFQPVSRYYPQLETLEICMNRYQLQQRIVPQEFTTNLKDISLTIFVRHYNDGVDFFGLTSLIEHSPFLSRFSLKLKWGGSKPPTCMSNVQDQNSKGPHQCLKVVEIFGFIGYTDQNEATIAIKFAKYLIQNAVALETVFIKQETHISTHKRIKLKREPRDILPPGAMLTLKRQTQSF